MRRKNSSEQPPDFVFELSQQKLDRKDSQDQQDPLQYSEDESINEGILAELRAEQEKAEQQRRMELLAESQASRTSSNSEDKRRERKAIFSKYKRQEEPIEEKKDLMIAFDEIFKKKETRVSHQPIKGWVSPQKQQGPVEKPQAKFSSPAKTEQTSGQGSLMVMEGNDQQKLLESLKFAGKDSINDQQFKNMVMKQVQPSPVKQEESMISRSHLSKIYPIQKNDSIISCRQSSDLFEELLKENIFNDLSKIEGDTNKSSLLSGSLQLKEDIKPAVLEIIEELDQPKPVKIQDDNNDRNDFETKPMDISDMQLSNSMEVATNTPTEVTLSIRGLMQPPNLVTQNIQSPQPTKQISIITAPTTSLKSPQKQPQVITVAPLTPFKQPEKPQEMIRPTSPPVPAAIIQNQASHPRSPIKLMTEILRERNMTRPVSQASFEVSPAIESANILNKQTSLGALDISPRPQTSFEPKPVNPLANPLSPFSINPISVRKPDLLHYESEPQMSVCPLLRQAHRLNSTSANTSLDGINLICYRYRDQTSRLVNELISATNSLLKINDDLLQRQLKQQELYRNFKPETFTQGSWLHPTNVTSLKPIEPYERHNVNHIEVQAILRSTLQFLKQLKISIDWKVNFTSSQSKKLYWATRNNLDKIFTNLKTISQDLYNKSFVTFVPEHWFSLYEYLKDTIFPMQNTDLRGLIGEREAMLTLVRFMRESHDPLCSSSLGLDLVSKLENEIRRLKGDYYSKKNKRAML